MINFINMDLVKKLKAWGKSFTAEMVQTEVCSEKQNACPSKCFGIIPTVLCMQLIII
jgi:hypothetical protein